MRELSLPQIKLIIAACDRRDALLAMQSLETTHAALAPIMVGREGRTVFEKCVNGLKGIIWPSKKKSDAGDAFAKMLKQAKMNEAAASRQKLKLVQRDEKKAA